MYYVVSMLIILIYIIYGSKKSTLFTKSVFSPMSVIPFMKCVFALPPSCGCLLFFLLLLVLLFVVCFDVRQFHGIAT